MVKDFAERKDSGKLLLTSAQDLQATFGTPKTAAATESNSQEQVRFGTSVVLRHKSSGCGVAACITSNNLSNWEPDQAIDVAGAKGPACVRMTFEIVPVDDNIPAGSPLNFGSQFRLKTQAPRGNSDLFLSTERVSLMSSADLSQGEQKVSLVASPSHGSTWQALCYNPSERLETEGEPVISNQIVIINSCSTNNDLCANIPKIIRTEFGVECEITAKTKLSTCGKLPQDEN
eukprot:UC4_evm1s1402